MYYYKFVKIVYEKIADKNKHKNLFIYITSRISYSKQAPATVGRLCKQSIE
jgi:hypothetical protein